MRVFCFLTETDLKEEAGYQYRIEFSCKWMSFWFICFHALNKMISLSNQLTFLCFVFHFHLNSLNNKACFMFSSISQKCIHISIERSWDHQSWDGVNAKVNTLHYQGTNHARKRPPQHNGASDLPLTSPFSSLCVHLCPLYNMFKPCSKQRIDVSSSNIDYLFIRL